MQEILNRVASGELSVDQAAALIAAKNNQPLRCKVADKGGVSVYGVNSKWPVTLYAEQWERLLSFADGIREFIKANKSSLKSKAA